MNRIWKRWISIFGVLMISITMFPAALVVSTERNQALTFIDGDPVIPMECAPTYIPYRSGDKYDVIIPCLLNDGAASEYLWLQDTLASCPITEQNSLEIDGVTVDTLIYDASAAPLNIPNIKEIVGVSYSTGGGYGTYSIGYYTLTGGYVILQYISDGKKIKCIRGIFDNDILVYDSAEEFAKRYQESNKPTSKQIHFPAPQETSDMPKKKRQII